MLEGVVTVVLSVGDFIIQAHNDGVLWLWIIIVLAAIFNEVIIRIILGIITLLVHMVLLVVEKYKVGEYSYDERDFGRLLGLDDLVYVKCTAYDARAQRFKKKFGKYMLNE